MEQSEIEDMIRAIIGAVDYDIAKDLDPETAEEPELAEELMNCCVKVAKQYLGNE